jgi:hypothetical protein
LKTVVSLGEIHVLDVRYQADYLFWWEAPEVFDLGEAPEHLAGLRPPAPGNVTSNEGPPAKESSMAFQHHIHSVERQASDYGGPDGGQHQPGLEDVTVAVACHMQDMTEELNGEGEQQRAATKRHQSRRDSPLGSRP